MNLWKSGEEDEASHVGYLVLFVLDTFQYMILFTYLDDDN